MIIYFKKKKRPQAIKVSNNATHKLAPYQIPYKNVDIYNFKQINNIVMNSRK